MANLERILKLLCDYREAASAKEKTGIDAEIDAEIRAQLGQTQNLTVQQTREWIRHEHFPAYWAAHKKRGRPEVRK